MIFLWRGGMAFLQGHLRFPQGFWMVFGGEFVVVWWWERGFWVHVFTTRKFSSVLRFIFGWGYGNAKATTKAKAMDLVASPCGLRSGLRQSGSAFRRGFCRGAEAPRLIRKATARKKAKADAKAKAKAKADAKAKAGPPPTAKDDNKKLERQSKIDSSRCLELEFVEGFGVGVEDHVG